MSSSKVLHSLKQFSSPAEDMPQDAPAPLTRRALLYYRFRPDLKPHFDLAEPAGRARFVMWLYVLGLLEGYPLAPEEQAFLEKPAPTLTHFEGVPKLSLFGYLVYLNDKTVKLEFDLTDRDGYIQYLLWWYAGGSRLGHFPVRYEVEYLQQASPFRNDEFAITNLGKLVYDSRQDLQQTYDLKTAAGVAGLANWLFERLPLEYSLPYEPLIYLKSEAKPESRQTREFKPFPITKTEPVTLNQPFADGVDLVGFARAELGTGEDTRTVARSIAQLGFPTNVFSIDPDSNRPPKDRSVDDLITETLKYKVSLFNTPAMETTQLLYRFHEKLHRAPKYHIGYWAWELPRWNKENSFCFDFVNEIWASTHFTKKSFESATDLPVYHMPLPVIVPAFKDLGRKYFGLPEDQFLFLYMFDFNSSIHRKNPWAAVRSFTQAFTNNSNVGLVIKTMCADTKSKEWNDFLKLVEPFKNIQIINRAIPREEVLALVQTCDAYLSPHRSEGFGRTMAEAMLLKKPVIATGFSGNIDFCHADNCHLIDFQLIPVKPGEYPNSDGQVWADASTTHASSLLESVYQGRDGTPEKIEKAFRLISDEYSLEALGPKYIARIKEILKALD